MQLFKIKMAAKVQDGRHFLQFYEKLLLRLCFSLNNHGNLHNNEYLYQAPVKYDSYTDGNPIWPQNLRWPPRRYVLIRKLPKISNIFVVIVKLCLFIFIKCSYTCILTPTFYNQIICDQTNQDGRHMTYCMDILHKTTHLALSKTCKIHFLFD